MKRMGSKDGCRAKTINYINENYPEIFTIADAKRGDIGNIPQCT
jgi:orotidine-5'-phosphate decarboxylase